MNIFYILAYTSVCSAFLPALLGLLSFNKITKALKILSVFCFIKVLIECTAAALSANSINNMFLVHIFTPAEFVSIVLIFITLYSNRRAKILGYVLVALFCIYCLINLLLFQPITSFNSFPQGIQCIVIILLSLYYFYRLVISDQFIDIMKSACFWLFAGWLLYFSGTLFLFIFSYKGDLSLTFSIIHSVLNIFLNLIFTYAIWLDKTKSTLS